MPEHEGGLFVSIMEALFDEKPEASRPEAPQFTRVLVLYGLLEMCE